MQDTFSQNVILPRLLETLDAYKQVWQEYSKVTNPQWGGTIPELQLVIRGELCAIQQEGKDGWENLFELASPEDIIGQLTSQMQSWELELQTIRTARLPKLFTLADCKRDENGWSLSADLTAILGINEACCSTAKEVGWKAFIYDLLLGTDFVPEHSPLTNIGFRDDGMIRFVHQDVCAVQVVLNHLNQLIVEQLTISNPTRWAAAIGFTFEDGRPITFALATEKEWAEISDQWHDELIDHLGVHCAFSNEGIDIRAADSDEGAYLKFPFLLTEWLYELGRVKGDGDDHY